MKKSLYYLSFICCLLFAATAAHAQIITTVAGNDTFGYRGDGSAATAGELSYPYGVATDTAGYIYIADAENYRVRRVSTGGIITTVAGNGTPFYDGDGVPATMAAISPIGVFMDRSGNLYIADAGNCRIRKVSPAGIITTIAGTGATGYNGDGIAATTATVGSPKNVAVDDTGNVYIADFENNRIRKVNTSGIISTIAGTSSGGGYSGDGGPATAAQLHNPWGLALDRSGNIYISDILNNCIRKINSSGIISTFAGNGTAGFYGDGGPATAAELSATLQDIAIDAAGNLYIADKGNYRIRKVNTYGIITTIAGDGIAGYSGDGCAATNAEMKSPCGVAVDAMGRIYVCEYMINVVRMIYNAPAPRFTGGRIQSLTLCGAAGTDSINMALAVADSATGRTEAWSEISMPAHGALSATYTAASTGGILMPAGLFYTPVAGYRGTDTFSIVVADCADVPDTTTIALTIDALPAAGIIAGPDSICIAHPVTLSDTAAGGIWASANARATVSGAVISGISPGADTIFYIVSNICGADTATYGAGIFNCSLDTKNIAESSAPHIAIYPNPSDGAFTINISSNTKEQTHIVITNLDGEKVQEMNALTNMPINVTLSGPAGVYFISISTTNNTCNAKILIFND